MKTLHLLLGSSERRLSSAIQATVLDVCYNRVAVTCTNSMRPAEFLRQGCCGCYDLVIVDVGHLLAEVGRPEPSSETLIQIIWTINSQCSAPLVVLGAAPELEYRFLEAGADTVLLKSWKASELRVEIERLLSLPEAEEKPRRKNWSLAGLFGNRS